MNTYPYYGIYRYPSENASPVLEEKTSGENGAMGKNKYTMVPPPFPGFPLAR
jgi:hypothetical protein